MYLTNDLCWNFMIANNTVNSVDDFKLVNPALIKKVSKESLNKPIVSVHFH